MVPCDTKAVFLEEVLVIRFKNTDELKEKNQIVFLIQKFSFFN